MINNNEMISQDKFRIMRLLYYPLCYHKCYQSFNDIMSNSSLCHYLEHTCSSLSLCHSQERVRTSYVITILQASPIYRHLSYCKDGIGLGLDEWNSRASSYSYHILSTTAASLCALLQNDSINSNCRKRRFS